VFSRHVDAVVVELSWKRTVVIEKGHWEPRDTDWKPWGHNVRNVVRVVGDKWVWVREGDSKYQVDQKRTHFTYEEFVWHRYPCTVAGYGTAGVRWPRYILGPDQRVGGRAESYYAKFSVGGDGDEVEYVTELDKATWQTLEVGMRCRLKLGASGDEVKQVTAAPD
jgi:hypothetical protein